MYPTREFSVLIHQLPRPLPCQLLQTSHRLHSRPTFLLLPSASPCRDYRRLNTVTVPDRYPLPNFADFTSRVSGSTIFSKLDLQKGYYQVPMAEEDICKTAIITPFGMFKFLRLPFGLRNTGNTFQRMMDSILGDLPYCFTYVDDILVFSSSLEEHVDHLRQVFLLC